MADWRDKEDLDLTAEDLGAMLDAGEPVELTSTQLRPAWSWGGGLVVSGSHFIAKPGIRVSA